MGQWTSIADAAAPGATSESKVKPPHPIVIVIDGEIGAGKTTLIEALTAYLTAKGRKVCPIFEPIKKWEDTGVFRRFCKDPPRYALEFQVFVHTTRIEAVREAIKAMPDAEIYLLERSIYTDRHVFMETWREEAGPEGMTIYESMYNLHSTLMPLELKTAYFVYFKPTLDACMARVNDRARPGETLMGESKKDTELGNRPPKPVVTLGYQQKIRKAHESMYEGKHRDVYPLVPEFPPNNAAVIEDNGNFTANVSQEERDKVIGTIWEKIEKHLIGQVPFSVQPTTQADTTTSAQ